MKPVKLHWLTQVLLVPTLNLTSGKNIRKLYKDGLIIVPSIGRVNSCLEHEKIGAYSFKIKSKEIP